MVPGFLKLFDEHIKQTLIRNYRECTDFLTDPAIELMNDVLICKGKSVVPVSKLISYYFAAFTNSLFLQLGDEFPTVMHFAAYYGLEHTGK